MHSYNHREDEPEPRSRSVEESAPTCAPRSVGHKALSRRCFGTFRGTYSGQGVEFGERVDLSVMIFVVMNTQQLQAVVMTLVLPVVPVARGSFWQTLFDPTSFHRGTMPCLDVHRTAQ